MSETLGYITPTGFPGLPTGWVEETGTVPATKGGFDLFTLTHRKANLPASPKVLFVVHGLGEHIGRYNHLPHFLQNDVDVIAGFDHRGHGRSGGTRGHVDHFDDFVNDTAAVFSKVKGQNPKATHYLLAHSMGALVAFSWLKANRKLPFKAGIFSSPFVDFKIEIPAVKRVAAIALSSLWGDLQMATGIDPRELSRDPAVQDAHNRDMLVGRKGTPRIYTEFRRVMPETRAWTDVLTFPSLFVISLDDHIVSADASISFAKSQTFPEKKIVELPGFKHESMNDIGKEQVFEEISEWIKTHS